MTFSVKQGLFFTKVYYATKLYAKVKEKCKNEYPKSGNIPNSTIKCLNNKFEKIDSVRNTLGKRKKKMMTPKKQGEIIELIEATPTISSCYLESQVQVPHTSTNCAV